jgi:hypothetical protein
MPCPLKPVRRDPDRRITIGPRGAPMERSVWEHITRQLRVCTLALPTVLLALVVRMIGRVWRRLSSRWQPSSLAYRSRRSCQAASGDRSSPGESARRSRRLRVSSLSLMWGDAGLRSARMIATAGC